MEPQEFSRRARGLKALMATAGCGGVASGLLLMTWVSREGPHGGIYTALLALPIIVLGLVSGVAGVVLRWLLPPEG